MYRHPNNLERRDLIGLNILIAIVAVTTISILVGAINKQAVTLERTSALAARIDQHCGFIRLQLAEELDWLSSTDSQQKQAMAQISFDNFTADDWRGIALCAPEGVQIVHSCSIGDVSCMTAATANAVLMVGAR